MSITIIGFAMIAAAVWAWMIYIINDKEFAD